MAKVLGLDKLSRKLSKIADIEAGDLENALRLGGQLIVNEAKIQAPVLTGQLRRSINIWVKTKRNEGEARIGTNLEYARRIEFGFVGADKLGRRFNQAARPYLRPAAQSQRAKALSEIRAEIQRAIRKAL